jgi:murein L,D-transpeptidase YafK
MGNRRLIFFSLAIFLLLSFSDNHGRKARKRFFHKHIEGPVYIEVVKSDYELKVYDQDGWYATYPVVFGSKSLEDKMMAGDRKTPEGVYHIVSKRPHEKWDKMMLIDYPTKVDYDKFKERKMKGMIPKNAQIGSGIALHGTWPHDDIAVDLFQNWTNGCIALKNEDVDELYQIIDIGTKVTILH